MAGSFAALKPRETTRLLKKNKKKTNINANMVIAEMKTRKS
jgi:hypothetical protein